MSEEYDRLNRDHDRATQRQERAFHEVPGEAEADAVRDAFLDSAGSDPATVAGALGRADGPTQARMLSRLQRERGNAFVQRVVAESRGEPGRLVGRSQPEMVEEVLQRKGAGSPLPEGSRQRMESFFGADLGDVRLHTDGEAAALTRELNAQAFTVGRDIFFGEDKADVSSGNGQALLAHELTHVGQQGGFGGHGLQRQAEPEEEEEEVQRQEEEEELA